MQIKCDANKLPVPMMEPPHIPTEAPEIKVRRNKTWTKERTECLIQMVKEGMPQKAIADELGTSVCSVTKKIQRLRKTWAID